VRAFPGRFREGTLPGRGILGVMRWTKRGLVYAPDGSLPWAKHYAFPAIPVQLDDQRVRLYLASCDDRMIGRVGFIEVAAADPSRILEIGREPVLQPGALGMFDENGVLPTCILRVGGELWMYYVGYQLGYGVRYYQFAGLAISRDDGLTFERHSRVPILDRSDAEPLNRTSVFVLHDGGQFRMWYTAGGEWTTGAGGKSLPIYNLRTLESQDGKCWPSKGRIVIDFASEDEHALGRPWIYVDGDLWRMFFSSRTRSKDYRLGYAESRDRGRTWVRKDEELGLDVSESGWDSEMMAYATIAEIGGRIYLFYNGNGCGRTGFGYAVLESW
jgi:hypothetical protein